MLQIRLVHRVAGAERFALDLHAETKNCLLLVVQVDAIAAALHRQFRADVLQLRRIDHADTVCRAFQRDQVLERVRSGQIDAPDLIPAGCAGRMGQFFARDHFAAFLAIPRTQLIFCALIVHALFAVRKADAQAVISIFRNAELPGKAGLRVAGFQRIIIVSNIACTIRAGVLPAGFCSAREGSGADRILVRVVHDPVFRTRIILPHVGQPDSIHIGPAGLSLCGNDGNAFRVSGKFPAAKLRPASLRAVVKRHGIRFVFMYDLIGDCAAQIGLPATLRQIRLDLPPARTVNLHRPAEERTVGVFTCGKLIVRADIVPGCEALFPLSRRAAVDGVCIQIVERHYRCTCNERSRRAHRVGHQGFAPAVCQRELRRPRVQLRAEQRMPPLRQTLRRYFLRNNSSILDELIFCPICHRRGIVEIRAKPRNIIACILRDRQRPRERCICIRRNRIISKVCVRICFERPFTLFCGFFFAVVNNVFQSIIQIGLSRTLCRRILQRNRICKCRPAIQRACVERHGRFPGFQRNTFSHAIPASPLFMAH